MIKEWIIKQAKYVHQKLHRVPGTVYLISTHYSAKGTLRIYQDQFCRNARKHVAGEHAAARARRGR